MEYKLGEFILEKRKEKRMSLRELATKAGISATYLSDIENGRKEYDVSKNILINIKNALELGEDDEEKLYSLAKESTNGIPVDVIETINQNEELVAFLREVKKGNYKEFLKGFKNNNDKS